MNTMRLFQRNGWWYAELSRGKRVSLGTRDKAQAKRLFKELSGGYLEAKVRGLPPKPLEEFANEYLEYYRGTHSTNAYTTARLALNKAMAHFGAVDICNVSRRGVDSWLASMGTQMAPESANLMMRHFRASLNKAIEWQYLKANPCAGVKELKVQKGFPRFLTQEEVARLLAAEQDPAFHRLWRFLILSGVRRSEALAITWREVDWQRKRISLSQTKNKRPREVILTPQIAQVLEEIPSRVGRLWHWVAPASLTRHFIQTAKKAGLNCRLHDLRHTCASWAIMNGVSLRGVMMMLGHSSTKVTEIYAHLSQEYLEEAASKVVINARPTPE